MTAVAVVFAMFVVPAWRQRQAVAEILDLGGQVSYDYEMPGAAAPFGPAWLRELIGNDYFQTVKSIGLVSNVFANPDKITAALEQVAKLPGVDGLGIISAGLRADHIRQIAQLRSITRLFFWNVTDEGLAELAPMSQLRELRIAGTFTDAGLAHLANLRGLQTLGLEGAITGAGTAHLEGLPQLQTLWLDAPMTDADLQDIARLVQLRKLGIGGTVSDAGMPQLSTLSQLKSLSCRVDPRLSFTLNEDTNFDFSDTSPADVIDYIGSKHEFSHRFDDQAISDAGIRVDKIPITDTVTNLPLREALQRILEPCGLGFRKEGSTLVITSHEAAEKAHEGINQLRRALPNLRDVEVGW